MMTIIEMPSPNFDERREGAEPSLLILHYTGMKTAQAALERLTDEASKVSAHYTVDEDGTIYRHVAEDKRAWHAGKSFWRGETDINSHSIGIEMVNPGHVHGYRAFPEAQIESVLALCLEIMERHTIKEVLAHSDISPEREDKKDPGELFPWAKLAEKGVGVWLETRLEQGLDGIRMKAGKALFDCGYNAEDFPEECLLAFQRHFVPEAFEQGTQGEVCALTKSRLCVLLLRGLPES